MNRSLALGGLLSLGLAVVTPAQAQQEPIVRIANLRIEPSQLEQYKAALREEIEQTSLLEPGVLTLYAVAHKDRPNHITIFETYANQQAYEAHLKTPHFLKYKVGTESMVLSLELVETTTIKLGGQTVPEASP